MRHDLPPTRPNTWTANELAEVLRDLRDRLRLQLNELEDSALFETPYRIRRLERLEREADTARRA